MIQYKLEMFMDYLKKNYNYLIFTFFFLSILFWVLEIIYSLIIRNKFVIPGAWYGPWCPIYGTTFLLILAVFRKEDHVLLNFLKIFVTVTISEYIVSFVSEKVFNHIIWNYSNRFLNIHGRVCLGMSLLFAITGTVMMYYFLPIIRKIYDKIEKPIKYINIVLLILFFIDAIFSLVLKV